MSMKDTLGQFLQFFLAAISISCLVSLMVLFMGGLRATPDFASLLGIQLVAIPLSLAYTLYGLLQFADGDGLAAGVRKLWQATPQWLVFAYLLLNSLFLFGEVALIVVARALQQPLVWQNHVPLVALLACSTAFVVLFALSRARQGDRQGFSGRW